jgi:hypothetical protein
MNSGLSERIGALPIDIRGLVTEAITAADDLPEIQLTQHLEAYLRKNSSSQARKESSKEPSA